MLSHIIITRFRELNIWERRKREKAKVVYIFTTSNSYTFWFGKQAVNEKVVEDENRIIEVYHHTNEDIPTPAELSEWCVQNHVTAVAGLPFRLTEEMQSALNEKNIVMYSHTINNPEEAEAFRTRGIGVYTDYLYYNGEEFLTP